MLIRQNIINNVSKNSPVYVSTCLILGILSSFCTCYKHVPSPWATKLKTMIQGRCDSFYKDNFVLNESYYCPFLCFCPWKTYAYSATTWTGPLGTKLTNQRVNWEQRVATFFVNGPKKLKNANNDLTTKVWNPTTERKNRQTCALELWPLFLLFPPFGFQNGGGLIRI